MSIYDKLYNWQKTIVDTYKEKISFGLWLDMGLGKTPISLAFSELHKCNKIIIITLKSKTLETENDRGSFLHWLSFSNMSPYNIITKQNKEIKYTNNDVLLINYEALFNRKQFLSKKNKQIQLSDIVKDFIDNIKKDDSVCFIIDESHKMKEETSKQTKAIYQIKKQINFKRSKLYSYLLTGTPFTTGYIDLYTQLQFIGCNILKGQFMKNWCIRGNLPGLLGYQQPIVGYKNIDSLLKLVDKFSISLLTNSVIELPEQIFTYIEVPQSTIFKLYTYEYYKTSIINEELKRRNLLQIITSKKSIANPFYRNIDYPSENYLAETIGQFMLRAKELSIGFQGNAEKSIWYDTSRLEKLKDFLKNNPDNYLLFYNFTPELYELYNICEELEYNIDVYSGEIKNLYFYNKYSNQTEEQKFNNKKNIILANFASGSTGLNWQEYNKCIIFSIPNYRDYAQGIKRIHRIGQKNTVMYYIFKQHNWIDKRMLEALNDKKEYNTTLFEYDLMEENKNERGN